MKKNLNLQLKKTLKLLKNKEKRAFLKKIVFNDSFTSIDKRSALLYNSKILSTFENRFSRTRVISQCSLTWRTRSVYSFFYLSRISLRELASFGSIKGLRKSSW